VAVALSESAFSKWRTEYVHEQVGTVDRRRDQTVATGTASGTNLD